MAENQPSPLIVGLHLQQPKPDASELLQSARNDGFDFITTSLSSTGGGFNGISKSSYGRSDVTALTGRWWRTSIVGVVDQGNVQFDSAEDFRDRFVRQIEFAIHMGIPCVILPPPPTSGSGNEEDGTACVAAAGGNYHRLAEYARVVFSLALQAQSNNCQLWIKTRPTEASLANYDALHRLCDGCSNIGMALCMEQISNIYAVTANSNKNAAVLEELVGKQIVLAHKAIGMNLKAVIFPTKLFLTNKKGYPTLAKTHQVLFSYIMRRVGRTLRVIVEGSSYHEDVPTNAGITKCMSYLHYIRHLRSREEVISVLDTEEAEMETPYLDSLQRPLQPLKDHLEFSMYETFEKDPVKYAKYQEAVYMALKSMNLSSSSSKTLVVVVAGSGRGPLVSRAIQAFHQFQQQKDGDGSSVSIKVYALEKNPSAIVYLQSMAENNPKWQGIVTVINVDIRKLRSHDHLDSNKIDIIVSELLGSFGDNELSPECLDPLLESDCCTSSTISIPSSYTSWLSPVSSCRLHTEARQQAHVPCESNQPLGIERAMETSYVVRTHAASQTHREQPCWAFDHPSDAKNRCGSNNGKQNERSAALEFSPDPTFAAAYGCGYGAVNSAIASTFAQAPVSTLGGPVTIHGLLGTFTAVLFANDDSDDAEQCCISIAPHSFSDGMFSWFPLYFPFKEPIQVPEGSNISVQIWRKACDKRVWYEWSATVHRKGEILVATPIHNPNGRSSFVSA